MQLDRIFRGAIGQTSLLHGLLLGLPGVSVALAAEMPVCHRAGEVVKLSGRVTLVRHAGPPNFDSAARGDAIETHAVLNARKAICVASVRADGVTVGHHVQQLQLIDLRDTAVHQAMLAGCRRSCALKGRLMRAESGHHRTPFLLELD
jgi:hypothetical protein